LDAFKSKKQFTCFSISANDSLISLGAPCKAPFSDVIESIAFA